MIIDSYDINSEPIVKLENFYGEKQHLVKKCMVIFSKVIYEYMLEKFPCRQIAEVRACNGNIPVWTLPYEGETIGFYLTPIGSALAAGTIAEVNHLTGASVFIMFGSCGSLDKEATDGKFILPTEAYRGEGLSYYFAEPQDYIKIKNTDKLAEFFKERKLPYVQGRVWTTDSMLRETVNLVRKRKEEGCIAYDTFESSTRHDVFMICETWQNAEVLAAHEKSPHFGKYVGIIQELAEMKLEKFEF